MHYNSFDDTCFSITHSPLEAELVYRSRGPALSSVLNQSLLLRHKFRYLDRRSEDVVVNSLSGINLQAFGSSSGTPGLVGVCGENHTELEVIGIGGQALRGGVSADLDCNPKDFTSLDKCFEDVLHAEYPHLRFSQCSGQYNETQCTRLPGKVFKIADYKGLREYSEPPNGEKNISSAPFRFKRLAHIRPRCFGTDRITEIKVDDKMPSTSYIYARNGHGLHVTRLDLKNPSLDNCQNYFPMARPNIIVDCPTEIANGVVAMFVSPHETGVVGFLSQKRQLVIWDTTMSMSISKINLFKSTQQHISYSKFHTRWFGCLATDFLECGTFTDTSDCCLLGGAKLYLVDMRSRTTGMVFPSTPLRCPHTYQYPRLDSRHPVPDRFTAIEKHPTCPSLYATLSQVSSSVLLWDIRNPKSIVDELPLPLIKQGRGWYRSLAWHAVPQNDENIYLLSAFCWEHQFVTINALSVYDSGFLADVQRKDLQKTYLLRREGRVSDGQQGLGQEEKEGVTSRDIEAGDAASVVESLELTPEDFPEDEGGPTTDGVESDEEHLAYAETERQNQEEELHTHQLNSNEAEEFVEQTDVMEQGKSIKTTTEFWNNFNLMREEGRSPFFDDPFILFPAASSVPLPVCDISGLCFSSSRPSIQIVIYDQLQVPVGTPSLESELRYFSPYGPLLVSSKLLLDEGTQAPLAEGILSQLFHGLCGIAFLSLITPHFENCVERPKNLLLEDDLFGHDSRHVYVFGLTFSGRLLALQLNVKRRMRLTLGNMTGESDQLKDTTTSGDLIERIVASMETPLPAECQRISPVPTFKFLTDAMHTNMTDEINRLSKKYGEHFTKPQLWYQLPKGLIQNIMTKLALNSKNPSPASVPHQILQSKGSASSRGFKGFFHSQLFDQTMKETMTTSLCEILHPNDDSLIHPTFAMGRQVNFLRQKLETCVYWRHPQFNAVHWPTALLDILLTDKTRYPTKKPSIFIPPMAWRVENEAAGVISKRDGLSTENAANDIKALEEEACNSDELKTVSADDLVEAKTLGELLKTSKELHTVENVLNGLNKLEAEGTIDFWIASTGGLDKKETPFESYLERPGSHKLSENSEHQNSMTNRSIASKVGTPLCVCTSVKEQRPFILGPSTLPIDGWHCPTVETQPVIYTPINSVIERTSKEILSAQSKRQWSDIAIPQDDLNFRILSRSVVRHLSVCPVVSNVTAVTDAKRFDAVGLKCDLLPNNKFCGLSEHFVFKKRKAQEEVREGHSLIQGSKFLKISPELFTDQTKRKEASEKAIRYYPKHYASLQGVRITSHLYENLRSAWTLQEKKGFTNQRTSSELIPKSSHYVPNTTLNQSWTCSASSDFFIPYEASTHSRQEQIVREQRKQDAAFGAISSQLTSNSRGLVGLRQSINELDARSLKTGSVLMKHLFHQPSEDSHSILPLENSDNLKLLPNTTPSNSDSSTSSRSSSEDSSSSD